MITSSGTAPPPVAKQQPSQRFAAIPNILKGKALCAVIKKWQERQATTESVNSTPGINWEDISRDLNRSNSSGNDLTPAACHILWRYLAYGQILTEEDLRNGTITAIKGTPIAHNSNKGLAFPAPHQATTAHPRTKASAHTKKPTAKKSAGSGGAPTITKKRPGTIYVACVHCQKEVSHSNIAAHIRKAHPELAKEKRERKKKPRTTLSPGTTTVSVIASGVTISNSARSHSALDKSERKGGNSCHRSECPHCKANFSRSHLSKHIKKQHPVEAVMESLVRKVVLEADYPTSALNSSSTSAAGDVSAVSVQFSKKLKTNDGIVVTTVSESGREHLSVGEDSVSIGKTETEEERRSRQRRESATATCKYCNVTITKKHMIVHIRKLHPEKLLLLAEGGGAKSVEHQNTSRERSDKYPTVACNYCGKEITKKSIRAHVRNLHPEVVEESAANGINGSKPYAVSCPTTQCKYCGKTITKKSIRAHVRNIHPEAAVEEVLAAASKAGDKSCSSASPLTGVPETGDTTTVKGNDGTVSCHYCHMRFPPSDIPNHIRYSHERTVTTLCKYCPKQIQNRNMNTHVRKYHVVESVLEVLVGKVASLNETQPAVLNCSLPGSRLHAINALSSAGGAKLTPTPPFSTQRELDERDALHQKGLQEVGKIQSSMSMSANNSGGSGKASKRILARPGASAPKKKMKSGSSSTQSAGRVQPEPSDTDFSNLHLLATFASTLPPVIP